MKIRIKHILRCYQSGMSIRSISSSLLISRNTLWFYVVFCRKYLQKNGEFPCVNKIHKVYKSLRICDYVSNKEKCKR